MIKWLIRAASSLFTAPHHAHNRAFDLRVLWPIMKQQARDLEHARQGFVIHMGTDDSWRALCAKWDEKTFNDWVEKELT